MEGRVRKADNRVRITAQLIDTADVMVRHTFAWDGLRDDARVNEMLAAAGL